MQVLQEVASFDSNRKDLIHIYKSYIYEFVETNHLDSIIYYKLVSCEAG